MSTILCFEFGSTMLRWTSSDDGGPVSRLVSSESRSELFTSRTEQVVVEVVIWSPSVLF